MYRLSAIIAILLTVLFSTPVLAFDKEPVKIDVSSKYLGYSYVKINTFGSALGAAQTVDMEADPPRIYHVKKKTSFVLQGVGFVAKEGYIVTAAHAVHPFFVTTSGKQFSYTLFKPIKILERHIVVSPDAALTSTRGGTPVEIYHLDIANDLAILKYDKDAYDILKPVPFKMACTMRGDFSNITRPGDAIAIIARKRDERGRWEWDFEVRNAKITSNKIHDMVPIEAMVEYGPEDFLTDILVYGGDSGSPAIAFDLGEPVVIGVFRSTLVYRYGAFRAAPDVPITTVVRIDSVKLILDAEE